MRALLVRPKTVLFTVLCALLLAPGVLRAGGRPEGDGSPGNAPGAVTTQTTVDAFWILTEGTANAEMLLERFYLPTSLAVLRWTDFRVTSDEVELSSDGGYRVVRKEAMLEEKWQGAVLRGYRVRVSFTGEGDRAARSSRRLSVSFSYDTSRTPASSGGASAVTPQPLQQALLKGIEASGREAGRARVLDLEYRGTGRFRATVEVQ